jgi:hypothetical protein
MRSTGEAAKKEVPPFQIEEFYRRIPKPRDPSRWPVLVGFVFAIVTAAIFWGLVIWRVRQLFH